MQRFTFKISKLWCFLMLLFLTVGATNVRAQEQITVSGTVSSGGDGSSIPGANVIIKNTPNGTAADANGKYSIKVQKGATLVFSAIGYENVEINITRSSLNVRLPSKQNGLNEVLVIGYGTSTRHNITTAISKVDPKNIPAAANNSVPELLFGRAPGLQAIQGSTQPGGGVYLSIRGQGSPLIVVDGAIYPNSGLEPDAGAVGASTNGVNRGMLEGLNPNDIESIEVLKDASAAIYGVNAANGVILITTKKGKKGNLNINANVSHSIVDNTNYLKPLDASQYETLFNTFNTDEYLAANKMYPYGSATPSGIPAAQYSAAQIAAAGKGTNWLDQIFRVGNIDNDNLSISGGTDKATYFFSGGYFHQLGTLDGSDMTKFTGRANMSFNLAKWVTLNTNFTGSNNTFENSSSGGQGDGSGQQGFGIVQAALAFPSNIPVYTNGTLSTFQNISNPVGLEQVSDYTYYHSLDANLSADFKLIPDKLTGTILFHDLYETATRNFFVPSSIFFYQQYLSRATLNNYDRENQTLNASLTYKDTFAKILNVDLLGSVEQDVSTFDNFIAEGTGAQDGLKSTNLGAETGNVTIGSGKYASTTRSYIGRASLTLLNRYLLTASIRDDGFSLFYPTKQWAIFPSVSAGWVLSDEPFFKTLANSVNLLKIRGSYGVTGVAGSNAFGGFAPDGDNIFLTNQEYVTVTQYQVDNPNLHWPKTIDKDLGLDFGFLKNRISGSFDYFRNDMTQLIFSAPTPPLSALSSQVVNGGHQVRDGYDFGVNSHNVNSGDFDWSTQLNISHYFYRWQERFPYTVLQQYQSAADPVDEIYYYKTKGLLQPGQPVPASQPTAGGASLPGSPIFVDKNGDDKLDWQDVYKRDADPKISLGFGNTFRYKQFDLTAFFYGQFGGWGTNFNYQWGDPLNIATSKQAGTIQAQQAFTSTNLNGTRPSVNYNEAAAGLLVGSDLNLQSTNFVRLRNLTLGYTLNSNKLNKFAKSVRFFVDAQNLFIITKFTAGDPEVSYASVKGAFAPYPVARTFSAGLKASF